MNSFIDNKYTKWYFSIIDHAKKNIPSQFYETHHIIPKSLGGNNDENNLVKLTYRQHFICHLLLIRMTTGKCKFQMIHAMWYMKAKTPKHTARSSEEVSRLSSRWFAKCKQARKLIGVPEDTRVKMSKSMIGKNVGKTASEETRAKMSIAAKSRVVSDSTKQKIAERVSQEWNSGLRSNVGQKRAETRSKNGTWVPPMLGKSHTEETRIKQSIAAKNDPRRKLSRGPLSEETKRKIAEKAKERWDKKREQSK